MKVFGRPPEQLKTQRTNLIKSNNMKKIMKKLKKNVALMVIQQIVALQDQRILLVQVQLLEQSSGR